MQATQIDPSKVSQSDVAAYRRDGYARFGRILTDDELKDVRAHVDHLVASLAENEWPERMNGIHNDDAKMLALCSHPRLLDVIEKFTGPNIVLFSSHLLCKPGKVGHEVPWHQDGIFWPLEPMDVLTLWLAIDDVDAGNGCMRIIPGTHTIGPLEHESKDTSENVLHLGMSDADVDPSKAVDIELRMGEFSLHEPWVIHGSNPNRSARRRAGYTMRFMPASTKMRRDGPYEQHKLYLVRGQDATGNNTYENA